MNESTTVAATETAATRFEGEPITLGGARYIIPPLSLGAVKRLFPKIQALQDSSASTAETVAAAVEVIGAALRRNYPQLTDEEVGELIDTKNMVSVLNAVITQSGFTTPASGTSSAGSGGGPEGNGSREPVSTT